MARKDVFTKILAIAGTVLVGLPVLAPIFFGILHWVRAGRLMVDFLLPAEFGLVVLAGAILLIWAAIRARAYIKWIAWSVGIAILLVVGTQLLAVVTGLASGAIQEGGWESAAVYGGIIGYDLAVISLFIGGVLLGCKLFKKAQAT